MIEYVKVVTRGSDNTTRKSEVRTYMNEKNVYIPVPKIYTCKTCTFLN